MLQNIIPKVGFDTRKRYIATVFEKYKNIISI